MYVRMYVHMYVCNENNDNRIERRNSRVLTISSLRHELFPTRTLKWAGRNSVLIGGLPRATCRVPRGTKGQFSYQI